MEWHSMTIGQVERTLSTDGKRGINDAQLRLEKYGKNELERRKKKGFLARFFSQLSDFMIILLIIAAGISFCVSTIQEKPDFAEPAIILAIVVLNAAIGAAQEGKAESALEALKNLSDPTAKVKRNGKMIEISAKDLVPGDIILLKLGDLIAADARILRSVALLVDESALTGESTAVAKDDTILPEMTQIHDRTNMVYAGSVVNEGHGEAIVVATGMGTEMGRIADNLISAEEPQTPLQIRLGRLGKSLGIGAMAICAMVFLLGVAKGRTPAEMLMVSVSLAVAAVPEGLPAIVTVILALGIGRMAERNAIVRKLPAVETLGSATVICTDKTGTLTQNRMHVEKTTGTETLKYAALCSNGTDATEKAIISAAGRVERRLRIREIPFDSTRKRMSVVLRDGEGYLTVVKGAPEVIVSLCADIPPKLRDEVDEMVGRGLRVLAVACRRDKTLPERNQTELQFVGLIGLNDPPRPEAEKAVRECRRAGIRVVMITGDNAGTAGAIAERVGILKKREIVMTGAELDAIDEKTLRRLIGKIGVFARVTPEHKVRIVRALRANGEVVAMTGDGVNDAPALRGADIGCAMGKNGTEVAKAAADMILTDDNFATVVDAVREGRGIYENIRRTAHFLISSNIGEILMVFVAILLGWPSPLTAIQMLWMNLVTDSLPAIALGMERPDANMMLRSPTKKELFSPATVRQIIAEGALIGALAISAFGMGIFRYGSLKIGRTMGFAVLSMEQLVHAFNLRSDESVLKKGLFGNPYLVGAFLICSLAQIGAMCVPSVGAAIGCVALTQRQWIAVASLSVVPLAVVEISKAIPQKRRKR